jgi:hypothetical protein
VNAVYGYLTREKKAKQIWLPWEAHHLLLILNDHESYRFESGKGIEERNSFLEFKSALIIDCHWPWIERITEQKNSQQNG